MTSQPGAAGSGRDASVDVGTEAPDPGATDDGRRICVVCQRPLDEDRDLLWRGEPVHLECGAELRCGISLGGRPDR